MKVVAVVLSIIFLAFVGWGIYLAIQEDQFHGACVKRDGITVRDLERKKVCISRKVLV